MEANPFSIDSILKKTSSSPNVEEEVKEPQPSKSSEALSLAVKLAGKFKLIYVQGWERLKVLII